MAKTKSTPISALTNDVELDNEKELLNEPLAGEMCTVTVTAGTNAEGGTLTMNDTPAEFGVGKEFPVGTQVTVKVVKAGFNTFTEQVNCDSTEPKSVTANLTKQQFLVTVNRGTDASDAVIQINGEAYTAPKNFDYGTKITVTATKEGFNDFSQVITSLTKAETVTVNLTKKQFLVTVNRGTDASDAVIQINDEAYTAPKNFDYGTKITVTATKAGYKNFSQVITSLTKAETVTVNMVALVKPTITTSLQNTINAEEETAFNVVVNGKDYAGTSAKIKGTVNQKDLVTLKYNDSPVVIGGDGTFEIDSKGFSLTGEDITKAFKITVADGTSLNLKLELLKQDNGTSLCDALTKTITVTDKNCNLKVVKGSNAEGASVTISYGETHDEPLNFDTNKRLPVGTQVTIKATKIGFVNFVEKVTLVANEDKSVTVNLTKQQFTVTINNQNESTITVNDAPYTAQLTLDYGTRVVIKANKTGFVEYTKTIESLTKNETIDISDSVMTKQQFRLTVVPTPSDATVKLNGSDLKEITVDYGTDVKIEVSKKGYQTHTETVNVTSETSKPVTLQKENYTLTITTNPSDAIVKLNSEVKRKITVPFETEVQVEVSKTGYETQSESVQVTETTTKNYELVKTKVNVTVKATEGDLSHATITVGGKPAQANTPVQVNYGDSCEISVTQEGFKPFTKTINPTGNTEVLVHDNGKWLKPKVTVTTIISAAAILTREVVPGAVIKINSEVVPEGVAKEIDYNTEAKIEVTAEGYNPYNETKLITEDYACVANMTKADAELVTLTITTTPDDATVKLNGSEKKSLEVEKGTSVAVEVTREGYESVNESVEVNETMTKNYDLVIKKFTLTVNATPDDATVKINSVEQKSLTADYNTAYTVEVSKEGYKTHTESGKLTDNKTIDVVLEEEIVEPGDAFIEEITPLLLSKDCYSYLNCSRHIIQNGINEESLKEFYKEFGYYVMSKTDFKVWRLLHEHFGHIEGIPEAENDKFVSDPIKAKK